MSDSLTPLRAKVLRAVALGHIYRTSEPATTTLVPMQHVACETRQCSECGLLRYQNVSSAVAWLVAHGLALPAPSIGAHALPSHDGRTVLGGGGLS